MLNQIKMIDEKINLPQVQLASILTQVNDDHITSLNEIRDLNIIVSDYDKIQPSLRIVLSFYLDEDISNLNTINLQELKLSQQDWYLLKAFANSQELISLLDRGEMSSEYVELSYLKDSYLESELSYKDTSNQEF